MAAPLATLAQIRDRLPQEPDTEAVDSRINEHLLETHTDIEIALGFTYERDVVTWRLDATDDPELILPGPGIDRSSSITVVENGITLVYGTDYEIAQDSNRYLIRLDSENRPKDWYAGRRIVQVTYVPARAPEALVGAEIRETIRSYRGAQAGYADTVGVDGKDSRPYNSEFTSRTMRLIAALKKGDGVGIW